MISATGAIGLDKLSSWLRRSGFGDIGRYEDPDPMGAPGRVADWIELSTLTQMRRSVSKLTVIDHLLESGLLLDQGDEQAQAEEVAASAFRELGLRHLQLKGMGAYGFPFALSARDTVLRRSANWRSHALYTFLLFVSSIQLQQVFREGTTAHETGHLFEQVVEQSLVGLFSAPVQILATSGPGRLNRLANRVTTALTPFRREVTPTLQKAPTRLKDGGLDVIARLSVGDDRPGCAHILVQCSAGADWPEKIHTPVEARWRDWVRWRGPLYRAIAVPTLFGSDTALESASRDGSWTLVLDRRRILFGLSKLPRMPSDLNARLRHWCSRRISHLQKSSLLDG